MNVQSVRAGRCSLLGGDFGQRRGIEAEAVAHRPLRERARLLAGETRAGRRFGQRVPDLPHGAAPVDR